jgi:hypothetical protein
MYVKGNPKNCRLRVFDAHMSKQAATASEKIHYVPTYLPTYNVGYYIGRILLLLRSW